MSDSNVLPTTSSSGNGSASTETERIRDLEAKVRRLEAKVSELSQKQQQYPERRQEIVNNAKADERTTRTKGNGDCTIVHDNDAVSSTRRSPEQELTADEIERYSRQLILTQGGFGVAGQRKLLSASVLVIGAGGIGSTLLMYLATAGVGHLGIVDFDAVEISNLHRQVIHRTDRVGLNKAESARQTIQALNPNVTCTIHPCQIDFENALQLVEQYDCIVDCCDNPQTRYLVNDACVITGKTLVSGSAVGLEGQITVYNYQNGPCYRCLYPRPSATAGCRSCSDAGVFGPVPGLIGILQATETIKVITRTGTVLSNHLLMYDSTQARFLSIKKPPKRSNCPVCGPNATIQSMEDSRATLLTAMGPRIQPVPPPLADELQVTCSEFHRILQSKTPHVLLDVRVQQQYDLCHLPGSVNMPLDDITGKLDQLESLSGGKLGIYCLCRRGLASVEATRILQEAKVSRPRIHSVFNISGGLDAWRETVDSDFPKY